MPGENVQIVCRGIIYFSPLLLSQRLLFQLDCFRDASYLGGKVLGEAGTGVMGASRKVGRAGSSGEGKGMGCRSRVET